MKRQDLVIKHLQAHGWTEIPNLRTKKYRVFGNVGKHSKYFIGKAGAVRFGPCISRSRSQTDWVDYKKLAKLYAS